MLKIVEKKIQSSVACTFGRCSFKLIETSKDLKLQHQAVTDWCYNVTDNHNNLNNTRCVSAKASTFHLLSAGTKQYSVDSVTISTTSIN